MSAKRLSVIAPMSSPSKMYLPAVGTSRQPSMFISVDLPEPDAPITATISPSDMDRLTPASAATSTLPIVYILVTSVISIIIGLASAEAAGCRLGASPAAFGRRTASARPVFFFFVFEFVEPLVAGYFVQHAHHDFVALA